MRVDWFWWMSGRGWGVSGGGMGGLGGVGGLGGEGGRTWRRVTKNQREKYG